MENNNQVYSKMFTWLFIGLLVTFVTGYSLSQNVYLMANLLSVGIWPIFIVELILAVVLSTRIAKMNPITTKILYLIYSITTGITFSAIFVVFKMSSIISIFLVTAIIFGVLAFYGYVTKRDLTKFGTILLVALLSMIIFSVINIIFIKSSTADLALTMIGILVFAGYIAYDVNKVKYLMNSVGEEKAAVYGAFQLYLDFINLFIRLLELFGKRND